MFSLNLDHQATLQSEGQGHPQIPILMSLGLGPGKTHLLQNYFQVDR